MDVVVFLLILTAAGLGGFAVLVALGLAEGEAWALGRVAGVTTVALVGWWAGVAGFTGWKTAGAVVGVAGVAWGGLALWRRRSSWRQIVAAEAVFVVGFLGVMLLRLPRPDILATEKLMDLGILASLLRAEGFPPPDMWLAGEALPYYYWGAAMWAVPLWLGRVALEVGYNLVVAALGGVVASAAWALGRRLGGGRGGGLAAFLAVFAGTPDGLRQVLAGRSLGQLDLWASSRQVPDAITEFPLFTLWLGDLHPHLLSAPLALLTMALALHCGRSGARAAAVAATGVAFGATWAANPWAMPPTLAAAGLLLLTGDGRWRWPAGPGLRRWLLLPVIAASGWIAAAPFHLAFEPPFQGIGAARAWTLPADLLLYAGVLLVPPAAAVVHVLRSRESDPARGRAVLLAGLAGVVLLAAVLGSVAPEFTSGERTASGGLVTLVFLTAMAGVLATAAMAREVDPHRPALVLGVLGLLLLAAPELVFVRDPYGDQLHRMNTVFKAYFQAWLVLSLAAPVLLRRAVVRASWRAVVTAVMLAPCLPHLAAAGAGLVSGRPLALDGLGWMDPGDRAVAILLRDAPPGTALVEAVGDPYTRHARISSASGVPAVLGWANHELVWRGAGVGVELRRRAEAVDRLYACGDPLLVRTLARELGADLVVVGSLERQAYAASSLESVLGAGEIVFEQAGAAVVRMVPAVEGVGGG